MYGNKIPVKFIIFFVIKVSSRARLAFKKFHEEFVENLLLIE